MKIIKQFDDAGMLEAMLVYNHKDKEMSYIDEINHIYGLQIIDENYFMTVPIEHYLTDWWIKGFLAGTMKF